MQMSRTCLFLINLCMWFEPYLKKGRRWFKVNMCHLFNLPRDVLYTCFLWSFYIAQSNSFPLGYPLGKSDHVYFVHPRLMYRPIYRPIHRSSVGQHIDWYSADVSVDISADIRPTYRPRYVGRYVGWHIDRDCLSDCQPTCRSIGYRHCSDTSLILVYGWV